MAVDDKPTYLGTLNRIAVGESRAHQYFSAWAEATASDEVRAVLRTVALREGEHGLAFAKRIDELGYTVEDIEDPNFENQMAMTSSTELTDLEKMDELGLGPLFEKMDRGENSGLFDKTFSDHSIDIITGGLLGRYICEERDTLRLLKGCYDLLKESSAKGPAPTAATLRNLEAKVDAICSVVEEIRAALSIPA